MPQKSVVAKFFVSNVVPSEGNAAAQVTLGAVCRGVENAMWAQYTPGGTISMSIKNDLATEQFVVGQEYRVLFTPVDKPAPGDGHPFVYAEDKYGAIVCETCGMNMGHTSEQAERYPHLAQYATEEYYQDARKRHDEIYGGEPEDQSGE